MTAHHRYTDRLLPLAFLLLVVASSASFLAVDSFSPLWLPFSASLRKQAPQPFALPCESSRHLFHSRDATRYRGPVSLLALMGGKEDKTRAKNADITPPRSAGDQLHQEMSSASTRRRALVAGGLLFATTFALGEEGSLSNSF